MNKTLKQTLFWTPRIAGILFVLFISLFAADVFDMQPASGERSLPCSCTSSLPFCWQLPLSSPGSGSGSARRYLSDGQFGM